MELDNKKRVDELFPIEEIKIEVDQEELLQIEHEKTLKHMERINAILHNFDEIQRSKDQVPALIQSPVFDHDEESRKLEALDLDSVAVMEDLLLETRMR